MTVETNAVQAGGGTAAPVVETAIHIAGGDGDLSVRDAARSLIDWRHKRNAQDQAGAESAAPEPATESAEQADAGEAEAPPPSETETQEAAEEQLPPLDAPRSWTAEDKDIFKTLPRETQERLVERERARENDFNRRTQEAAEKLKGLTTKEQEAEHLRQQYESALPVLLQTLQQTQAGEFSDIRSIADVEKMAADDWPRYVRWDANQKRIAAVHQEVRAAQERTAFEQQAKFAEFAREQDKLFVERTPEFADKDKAAKMQSAAIETLKSLGFTDDELGQSWSGQERFSLRDHRIQSLILDAARYREAQETARKVVAKPVPPVQRPGVAPTKGAGNEAAIATMEKQLANASGVKALRLAAELTKARRAAR